MKINQRQSTAVYTQPVSLMLLLKCVQRLPFCFTYLTLSKYQVYEVNVILTTSHFRRFLQLKVVRVVNLKLVFTEEFSYNLEVRIKLYKTQYLN